MKKSAFFLKVVVAGVVFAWAAIFVTNSYAQSNDNTNAQSNVQDEDTLAVQAPDLAAIEKIVKENRPLYDSLTNVFKNLDTTTLFTQEEVNIIYYGYAFTSKYNPYFGQGSVTAVKELCEQGDFDKAKQALEQALENNPVNLSLYEWKLRIAEATGDENSYIQAYNQLVTLINTITLSGEGTSKESPFYVISILDEYVVLSSAGYDKLISQRLIETSTGPCDEMTFTVQKSIIEQYNKTSEEKIPEDKQYTLYFNVSIPMGHLNKMLDD